MSSPAKRALTSDAHDNIKASNAIRNDLLSDDLAARLQNIGSRVRKSVAEGYNTPSATPPTQSPTKHTTPSACFVPTAKETLQNVFGSPTRLRGTPSPLKRGRSHESDDDRDEDNMSDDDDDVFITPSLVVGSAFPLRSARPVRPLRRSRISQPVFAPSQIQDVTMMDCAPPFATQQVPVAVGGGTES
ncbi:hypothetical protein EXIGLDRAFT_731612 [Exidia glandulosa HHB12029]|uniref:Uncharacterized protein n=1 Tax=Exidia glandulosa HHB12029 TaxID=1314781 RepID=A0A165BSZ8_EXIGL|nr:hypothetical protein EXIGLDRAFT_731612 [Exidia glandulosa HHB12029]